MTERFNNPYRDGPPWLTPSGHELTESEHRSLAMAAAMSIGAAAMLELYDQIKDDLPSADPEADMEAAMEAVDLPAIHAAILSRRPKNS